MQPLHGVEAGRIRRDAQPLDFELELAVSDLVVWHAPLLDVTLALLALLVEAILLRGGLPAALDGVGRCLALAGAWVGQGQMDEHKRV